MRPIRHNPTRKVVIITGASSGIGAAVARRLARDGLCLTLAARRLEKLEQVASEVEALGGEVLIVQTDVRNRDEIQRMVDVTLDRWGHIDVILNNAGIGNDKPLIQIKPEKIQDEVKINLVAVIECAQVVLPVMLRQKSGHIINVASIAGLIGLPTSTVYGATKFGVVGFSDALRRELFGTGIHVSAFCPGFTPTEINPDLKAIAEKPGEPHPPGLMPVSYVADQIARLIYHPRRRTIVPYSWNILVFIATHFPGLADTVIRLYLNGRTKGGR
ncbi:MAG: SDR family NAD(P)-dependent oxidoreductase [Anaerolineales bacterium]|jgi:short-subunit dehydrogenase